MSKKILVIPDVHAHPQHSNSRADYLADLIIDTKPDIVVEMGDLWDMPSLSSYDKGKRSFEGRRYTKDVNAGLDFLDRMWSPVRAQKKKLPTRYKLIGNHEERIARVGNLHPELTGVVSYNDLCLHNYYDDVVDYDGVTPGVLNLSGISFAHYHISGLMGRPIGGEHPAYTLVTKRFSSAVVGHSHVVDLCVRTGSNGHKIIGLVAGCYMDYKTDWAGKSEDLWWRGVIMLNNVENGQFDPEFISLKTLKEVYS